MLMNVQGLGPNGSTLIIDHQMDTINSYAPFTIDQLSLTFF